MELEERVKICLTCKNKKFSLEGVKCSLTGEKPLFENECSDFQLESEQKKATTVVEERVHRDKVNKIGIWSVIALIAIIARIILKIYSH